MKRVTTISIMLLVFAVCAMGDVSVSQARQGDVVIHPAVTSEKGVLTLDAPKDSRPGVAQIAVDIHPLKITGGYVVVASKATYENEGWNKVVKALSYKYGAETLVYEGSVTSVKEELSKRMPRYTCFIAKPEEATGQYVIDIQRLTRTLDNDPYTDTLFGILTGYSVRDALRIASASEPLVIRKALSATFTIPMEKMEDAIRYNESEKNYKQIKTKSGAIKVTTCPDDPTEELVGELNNYKPDMFITSGHSSEDNWLIGYNYNTGQFRCKNGVLYGLSIDQQKTYAVDSPNPKVYLAPGNCLMGNIKNNQSMALAYMGSCGVNQMAGYLTLTDHGFMGWGTYYYLMHEPGRFNLVESWYLNNQLLISKLEKIAPGKSGYEIKQYMNTTADMIAKDLGYSKIDDEAKEVIKLIAEKDTFALYGDPAWDARLVSQNHTWEQSLTEKDGVYTFTIKGIEDGLCIRPPAAFIPHRIKDVEIIEGKELKPVIADDFLLLPDMNKVEKNKIYKLVFKAAKMN